MRYDEYFNASQQASMSANVPSQMPVEAGINAQAATVVRAQYTLTDKWIADLSDPAAHAKCCAQADNNCSKRVIGEFIGGTGRLFYADVAATAAGIKAMGNGMDFKDGLIWRQIIEFPNPVFFAFKLTPAGTGNVTAPAAQANWDKRVPKVSHGQYFVGVSEWLDSEAVARETAMLDARRQLVRYLGELITQGGSGGRSFQGAPANLSVTLQDQSSFQRASNGVAKFVKDEDWKVEEDKLPNGRKYRAKVLAYIANDQIDGAAQAVILIAK